MKTIISRQCQQCLLWLLGFHHWQRLLFDKENRRWKVKAPTIAQWHSTYWQPALFADYAECHYDECHCAILDALTFHLLISYLDQVLIFDENHNKLGSLWMSIMTASFSPQTNKIIRLSDRSMESQSTKNGIMTLSTWTVSIVSWSCIMSLWCVSWRHSWCHEFLSTNFLITSS